MSEDGSQAKADQLRKGAWLQRSFTLSTLNFSSELPTSRLTSYFILLTSYFLLSVPASVLRIILFPLTFIHEFGGKNRS